MDLEGRQLWDSFSRIRKKIKFLTSLESENYPDRITDSIKKVLQKFAQIKKSLYLRTAFERKRNQKLRKLEVWVSG
mgnify:CR=1 FL=1